jgi:hypothetical protein
VPTPHEAGIGVAGESAKKYDAFSVEDFDKELFAQ